MHSTHTGQHSSIQHIVQTAPSDFHLFQTLNEVLSGRCFKSNAEEKDAIKQQLNGLVAEVYDEGIKKLITRYDKCLKVDGDCVEK